ncbi:zinc transporter ZupT [Clostridioides mangenotii]|uniref:zinc transporter ZupT n=1 Tax=Metaclostridioides mangenotii TaxID=1540 RepID=UPI001C11F521|nr:zinc transporter ZupT [Clostridioides mangenotii]MBU5307420.1 zinc transporter ZupT [Clostridioides mangenotii]MCR1954067.1 zinc transporter ZupT [Clostridioides mangenotii]
MDQNILFAFMMTLIAGLSTGIGSAIAFFAKKTNTKFLAVSLGFSAGVMIYVSMIEIFTEAKSKLIVPLGLKNGTIVTVLAFFGGMILIALIDKLIPSEENPHEVEFVETLNKIEEEEIVSHEKNIEDKESSDLNKSKLMRTGLFTALAIAIHNFPEGLATFVSALQEPSLAIPIVVAIAIHNIPEGIAVSVPIYYATGSKKKAFIYSFLSGLSEPIGAIIGFMILLPIMNDILFGVIFAGVAGIMVFISIDELLPSAREYGEHHLSIYGMVVGMAVMAASLIMFM